MSNDKPTFKEQKFMDKLGISLEMAREVILYDTKYCDSETASNKFLEEKGYRQAEEKVKSVKPKGIVENDLIFIENLVRENFKVGERFKNNDLAKLQERFTNRQTPSRLKKLVENGVLESEGTPKSYYLV